MVFVKGVPAIYCDRKAPRRGKFKLLRDLSMQAMEALGYDGNGALGIFGFVKKLAETQPELIYKLMMKPPRPNIKIDARSASTDEWRLSLIEKMQAQGFKLIEGQVNEIDEETESED